MTSTTATFEKTISYDRDAREFKAELDGNYIGHFSSYYEAEVALDLVAYDMLMDGQCTTATELDGGSDIDTIAADHAACPDCEGAGCSTCDGTPLTEDEIAAYTALAAHERKEHR